MKAIEARFTVMEWPDGYIYLECKEMNIFTYVPIGSSDETVRDEAWRVLAAYLATEE